VLKHAAGFFQLVAAGLEKVAVYPQSAQNRPPYYLNPVQRPLSLSSLLHEHLIVLKAKKRK